MVQEFIETVKHDLFYLTFTIRRDKITNKIFVTKYFEYKDHNDFNKSGEVRKEEKQEYKLDLLVDREIYWFIRTKGWIRYGKN